MKRGWRAAVWGLAGLLGLALLAALATNVLASDYHSRPGRRHGELRAKEGPFSFRFAVPGVEW